MSLPTCRQPLAHAPKLMRSPKSDASYFDCRKGTSPFLDPFLQKAPLRVRSSVSLAWALAERRPCPCSHCGRGRSSRGRGRRPGTQKLLYLLLSFWFAQFVGHVAQFVGHVLHSRGHVFGVCAILLAMFFLLGAICLGVCAISWLCFPSRGHLFGGLRNFVGYDFPSLGVCSICWPCCSFSGPCVWSLRNFVGYDFPSLGVCAICWPCVSFSGPCVWSLRNFVGYDFPSLGVCAICWPCCSFSGPFVWGVAQLCWL